MDAKQQLPWSAKIYVGLMVSAGLAVTVWGALHFHTEQPFRFLAIFVMALMASTLKVDLPGIPGTMSVNFLFILIGVLDLSHYETLLIGCTGGLLQLVWRCKKRPDLLKILFNVSSMAVAITATWHVFHSPWLIGLGLGELLRLGLAACVYFLFNTAPVALIIALTSNRSLLAIWQDCYFWSFPYYLIGAACAGLISASSRYIHWQTSLLLLPVIYFIYRSYRAYLGRLDSEKTHARELQSQTERLQKEIAERRRAELVLRESEERYRTLFESSPHPMWLFDPETFMFIEVNDAAIRRYGYRRDELLNMNIGDLCHVERKETSDSRDPSEPGEWIHRSKTGELFDVELRAHKIEVGGRPAMLVLADDITERKMSEELRVQKDAAVEANRAKSEFLANMSHELRTPLNAIIGYSELMLEDAQEAEQKEYVGDLTKIQTAGRHLLDLINEILDLSKIEAGRTLLLVETFDVRAMVQSVAHTVQPLVKKRNNALKVKCEYTGSMRADLTKTRQVLLNLVSNAAKFTEHGEIDFEVQREPGETGDVVVFTVRDTGIGMTLKQLQGVGQPFTQADASTTRKYGGTGLGLAISQHYCEMMGGGILAESRKNLGSTFTARIPVEVVSNTEYQVDDSAADPVDALVESVAVSPVP